MLKHHSFTRLHIIHLLELYSHISHYRCRHAHQLTTITTFTHGHAERRLHDDLTRRTRDGDDVLLRYHRLSALIVPEPGRRTLIRVRPRGRWRRSSWILHRKREHGLTPTANGGRMLAIRTRQNRATAPTRQLKKFIGRVNQRTTWDTGSIAVETRTAPHRLNTRGRASDSHPSGKSSSFGTRDSTQSWTVVVARRSLRSAMAARPRVRMVPAVAVGRNRARRSTDILLSCRDPGRSWRALSTAVVIRQRGKRRVGGDIGERVRRKEMIPSTTAHIFYIM